jgi:hypothetical protein
MINIVTILLLFACLVAYEYIRDLRRDLKDARTHADDAWRLYEKLDRELREMKGQPLPAERVTPEQEPKKERQGFVPGAIGRTAILDREFGQRDDDEMRRPANTPSRDEIVAAIQEATNGDGLG